MELTQNKKIFLTSAIIVAIVFFLSFWKNDRAYSSEMDILFLPKNEAISKNLQSVIKNAQEISATLSFYNEIVKNPDISDPVEELPDDKRKKYWDSKITVKHADGDNIIRLFVVSDDISQAEIINRQATATLISSMSHYYNIKTELDMRIVDGPIITRTSGKNIYILIIYSLISGILTGIVTSWVSSLFPGPQKQRKKSPFTVGAEKETDYFSPRKTLGNIFPAEEAPFEIRKKEEEKKISEKQKEVVADKIVSGGSKASAPINLPVADDIAIQEMQAQLYGNGKKQEAQAEEKPIKEDSDAQPETDIFREATPEEVKERLNKLLSGKF